MVGYIFKWWAFSVLIGIIAYPITFVLFKKSYDKGYFFSKIVGIFLISYFSWLIGFLKFSTGTIWLVILLLLILSSYLFVKNKKEIFEFLEAKAGLVLVAELFYLFVFLIYALFRMYQPDIIGTEKFMDFAFMNSIARAETMPPYDPWMYGVNDSGSPLYISYYYFGYVMMAIMMKLTGIPNGVCFNLSLTYIVAMSAIGMVGLLYNLTKNHLIGFLAAAFLLLISNLDGFLQVAGAGWSTEGFNWWHSSRIIDYKTYDITINEFPFFSFLLGDMHPHQMAIPFVLLALNTALSYIKFEGKKMFGKAPDKLAMLGFTGLLLGGLWFLNSWDFPTYFFITMLCVLSNKYALGEKIENWWKDAALTLSVILGIAIAAYLPFTLFFSSQAKGIGWVKANTKVVDYLIIFGIMLFPVLSFLVIRLLNWLYAIRLQQGDAGEKPKKRGLYCPRCGSQIREGKKICGQCGYMISGGELYLGGLDVPVKKANKTVMAFFKFFMNPAENRDRRVTLYTIIAVAVAAGLVVFKSIIDAPNIGVFVGIMFLALSFVFLLGMTRVEMKENQFVLILVFSAFLAAAGCEMLHIIDTFSRPGEHMPLERMNTVFKFYYQSWIFYSVAAAYGFFWVTRFYLRFKPGYIKYTWLAVFGLLVFAGLFYPFAASKVKTGSFRGYMSLDGAEFFSTMQYKGRMTANADYNMIEWIKKNIKGHPVVLEAWGGEYTEYARISSFTGLPTVIGWPGHELQWRGSGDEAGRRQADVDTIYRTTDIEKAKQLLEKYNVTYVYVGALERDKYPGSAEGLAKFREFMDIVHSEEPGTYLYKIRQ